MFETLALVIIIVSVFVFFSKEFTDKLNKLFEIRGVKLFLPLLLASWVMLYFESIFFWISTYAQVILVMILTPLATALPFGDYSLKIAEIFFLTLLPSLIVLGGVLYSSRRMNRPNPTMNLVALGLWLYFVLLWLIFQA